MSYPTEPSTEDLRSRFRRDQLAAGYSDLIAGTGKTRPVPVGAWLRAHVEASLMRPCAHRPGAEDHRFVFGHVRRLMCVRCAGRALDKLPIRLGGLPLCEVCDQSSADYDRFTGRWSGIVVSAGFCPTCRPLVLLVES